VEDKKEYIKYEIEFHQAIIRAAKNTILKDFMEKMYKVLYESRKRTVEQLRDVYRESYLEHYQIYRHIKEGDPKRAKKAMVDNLTEVEKRFSTSSPTHIPHRMDRLKVGKSFGLIPDVWVSPWPLERR
jgi:DNA-binding FadR family transcriptional regulator